MRRYLSLLLPFLLPLSCFGQMGKNREVQTPLSKDWNIGFLAHTRGYGLSLQFARPMRGNFWRVIDGNAYFLKHPKEIALTNPDNQESRPYVYGKLNGFGVLKGNIGIRYVIAEQQRENSVKLNFNAGAGPVFGIIKPIYYEIATGNDGDVRYEKFDPDNESQHHDIIGTAPFPKGWNEAGFIFGANAKTSLSFEWGNSERRYYSIESGALIDAFPVDVPIFAFIPNQKVFLNLFITLSVGFRRE